MAYRNNPLNDPQLKDAALRKAIKEAREAAPEAPVKLTKLALGGGLQLWLMPTGSALWRFAYRFGEDGKTKQKVVALAGPPYPAFSLAEAREEAEKLRKLVRPRGEDAKPPVDPAARRKALKLAAAVESTPQADTGPKTFAAAAEEMLAEKARVGGIVPGGEGKRRGPAAAATMTKARWLLRQALPTLGRRPIAELKRAEIKALLIEIEGTGRRHTAQRLRDFLGEVFSYAINEGYVDADPRANLKLQDPPEEKHHAAILDPAKFGGLLRAIDGFDGQSTTKAALRLMALVFPRPGELRMAEWSEFDLAAGVWTIPATRTKMRREHVAPLPRQAVAVLEGLRPLTGRGALVFPGYGTNGTGEDATPRPISENTMNAALRRMGFTKDEATAHGFRATASTLLNQSKLWHPDAIERALAHLDENKVRRTYDRGDHWEERVRMGQWWADYLDGLRGGQGASADG